MIISEPNRPKLIMIININGQIKFQVLCLQSESVIVLLNWNIQNIKNRHKPIKDDVMP